MYFINDYNCVHHSMHKSYCNFFNVNIFKCVRIFYLSSW